MKKNNILINARKSDNFLKKYLKKQKKSELLQAKKYGLLSGGKKIRSSIIIDTGKLFNIKIDKLLRTRDLEI